MMRETVRDVVLTVVTLSVAAVALVAGASLRFGLLFVALFLLWLIGSVFVWFDD